MTELLTEDTDDEWREDTTGTVLITDDDALESVEGLDERSDEMAEEDEAGEGNALLDELRHEPVHKRLVKRSVSTPPFLSVTVSKMV